MPALLYLNRVDVAALLPTLVEQVDLVERTYAAMAAGLVQLPPKPGIHPRKDAFIHAMPAYLVDGDVAAMKWVSGYPSNKALGLPYLSGLIILNDAETGAPEAVIDAVEITAARTAAASGVCVRRWGPAGWRTAALIGAGEQARYHARILRAVNPDVEITAYDPDASRIESLPGPVGAASSAREAVEGADVVVTLAPIVERPDPEVAREWLGERYLVLPVDFDASVKREVVAAAELFLVDDLRQYDSYRGNGHFDDWRRPHATVGEAVAASSGAAARVVCCNLGVGSRRRVRTPCRGRGAGEWGGHRSRGARGSVAAIALANNSRVTVRSLSVFRPVIQL